MKRIWIEDARRRAGLTQVELAEMAGTNQAQISRLETGATVNPSFAQVVALARALNVDPRTLRFGRREVAA